MDDAEMGKQTSDRMKGVFAGLRKVFDAFGRKVTQYEPGKEIAPGITSVATSAILRGTTRTSSPRAMTRCSCRRTSPTRRCSCAIRAGSLMFDQDANMAEATRRKVYDMLAAEKMMVQGFHYPFPARAYIEKTATGYRETMVPWNPTL